MSTVLCLDLLFTSLQAVTNLLNNDSVSDIDRLRLVMLYALRYEKESPVQLMQLFNKLASRSAKYKPGVKKLSYSSHSSHPVNLLFHYFVSAFALMC